MKELGDVDVWVAGKVVEPWMLMVGREKPAKGVIISSEKSQTWDQLGNGRISCIICRFYVCLIPRKNVMLVLRLVVLARSGRK